MAAATGAAAGGPARRETIGRVAAGAIAAKVLHERCGAVVVSYVKRVQDIEAKVTPGSVTREAVEAHITRCPDPAAAAVMEQRIDAARKAGDSLGGVVEAVAHGVPPGLGEPVFDKLDADLAKAMLSLPACRGFEIGSGFAGTRMTGSTHNDPFYMAEDASGARRVRTRSKPLRRRAGAASPTARRSWCAPPSSRPPPSCNRSRPSTKPATR